jgi:hypothetical protein
VNLDLQFEKAADPELPGHLLLEQYQVFDQMFFTAPLIVYMTWCQLIFIYGNWAFFLFISFQVSFILYT